MPIKKSTFGQLADGTAVELYSLANARGMEAGILTYGAILQTLLLPRAERGSLDVVLGFDTIEEYVANGACFGAIVGRYAGLIGRGRFTLDGRDYELACNDGANHSHGGHRGFDKRVWSATPAGSAEEPALRLDYVSRDGEEGYPGNLRVSVTYTVTRHDELRLDYAATTDRPTVLNLTNHSYFNLAGQGSGDILGHELTIHADQFQPIDPEMLPIKPDGPLTSVAGTALDFRTAKSIGLDIEINHEQIRNGRGLDHNYVVNGPAGLLRPAARLALSSGGVAMEMDTTEPGVQLYAGNLMRDGMSGKGGCIYNRRHGVCLEAQHYPDSPNHSDYPSTVLRPGQTYTQTTVYRFAVKA